MKLFFPTCEARVIRDIFNIRMCAFCCSPLLLVSAVLLELVPNVYSGQEFEACVAAT